MTDKNKIDGLSIDKFLDGLGSSVLKSIRDPFAIIRSDFSIIWKNKGMLAIHPPVDHDPVGKICHEVFYGRDEPCSGCPITTVIETGRTSITERWMDIPGGTRKWGEVKAYPIRGDDREIIAVIVIIIDITDRKADLEKQKEYSDFLSRSLIEKSDNIDHAEIENNDISIQVKLSKREIEVLRLLTEGYTNTQISELLSISPHTVKSHTVNIFNKLGVSDRTQAAVLATRFKLF